MSLRASTSRLLTRTLRPRTGLAGSAPLLCCTCQARPSRGSSAVPTTSARSQRFLSTSAASRATPIFQDANEQAALPPPEEHDIVIVGGGLVGLALANALCLCKHGTLDPRKLIFRSFAASSKTVRAAKYKISLLEAGDLDKIANWSLPSNKWSNRISSITEESQAFLSASGGWQKVDFARTRPCEEMQVWDGLTGSRIEFSAWDIHPTAKDQPEMAKFVENLNLQKALLLNMREQGRVECIDKTRVKEIMQGDVKEDGGWPVVELENGRRIRARLLVGADGFNSPVKTYSGIKTSGSAYDAHCLVGTLELATTALDTNMTAWQRFLPVGPLGFLPIAENYGSLAWSTKPEIAAALKKLDSETLSALINASFRLPWPSLSYLYHQLQHSPSTLMQDIAWRSSPDNVDPHSLPREHIEAPPIVKSVHLDTCASFPLKMSHAESYLGESELGGLPKRTVLIGDAAHTVHPMAGQGLNMGLGDAAALSATIEHAILEGADIGSKLALNPYPRQRYLTNHNIMSFIDKLHKLYAVEHSKPIVWARSTGVEILNELPSIKGAMMGTAGAAKEGFGNQMGKAGLWRSVAGAVEIAEGARALGGALLGGLRTRLASAINK